MKKLLLVAVVALLPCIANAAYIPDNNGRHVWTPTHHTHYTHVKKHTKKVYRQHKKYKKYAHRKKSKRIADANGNIVKGKSPPWNMVQVKTVQGFILTVHPAHAHKFLRFFEILKENNVEVPKTLVGCYSRRGHVPGSNHYNGIACDIQTGWNRTIPAMYHAGKWIKAAGLYDGCDFGDCGHIEAIKGTFNGRKLPNLYAAMAKFKADESTHNFQP